MSRKMIPTTIRCAGQGSSKLVCAVVAFNFLHSTRLGLFFLLVLVLIARNQTALAYSDFHRMIVSPTTYEHLALAGSGNAVTYIERNGNVRSLWVTRLGKSAQRVMTFDAAVMNYQLAWDGYSVLLLRTRPDESWYLSLLDLRNGSLRDVYLEGRIAGFGDPGRHSFKVVTQDKVNYELTLNSLDFSTGQSIDTVSLGLADDLGFGIDGDARLIKAADGKWKIVSQGSGAEFSDDGLGGIVGVTNDQGTAIFKSINKAALANFILVDTKSGARSELAAHPTGDVQRILRSPIDGQIDGYLQDGVESSWAFMRLNAEAVLKRITEKLGRVPDVLARSNDDSVWLIQISSVTLAPTYYVFDRRAGRLQLIAPRGIRLRSAELAPLVATVTSKDGTKIEARANPPDLRACNFKNRPCPFVLLIHGGPHHKDGNRYDSEVAWLHRSGYWVLRVNFRGSTGFGEKFANASDHEWGGLVIDDIRAALRWFKSLDGVNPNFGVAYGQSFGGFAAIALAVTDPQAVPCAASLNGGGDLEAFATLVPQRRPNMAEDLKKEIGDPSDPSDKSLIQSQSPMNNVRQSPVKFLVEYGAADVISAPEESANFIAVLDKLNNSYIAVRYKNEGHDLVGEPAAQLHYSLLNQFLAKCTETRGNISWPASNNFAVVTVGSAMRSAPHSTIRHALAR
jgi:dienelactone hydrolase